LIAKLLTRLTYANVISTLALFLALGGGAYAAVKLPSNSVTTKQIKPGAIKASDLGKGSVTLSKIKGNAVDGSKLINDSLKGADINESTLGVVPAAAALGRVDYETATNTGNPGSTSIKATATCPGGFTVVGGGASLSNTAGAGLNQSFPAGRNGWTADAFASGGAPGPVTVTAHAICAPASSTSP
jgi:hypothetical protein